jgi:putative ABC transport system permease protein
MKLLDSVEYAVKNLRTRQLRSWLTIVGIVIGVVAMVVITSVTEGVSKSVTDMLSTFGPDKMFVVPVNIDKAISSGSSFGGSQLPFGKLYQKDVDAVASVPGVKETARINYGRATVKFKDKEISTVVYGGDTKIFTIFGDFFQIETGRAYSESERRVVVLGYDAANTMWGKEKAAVGSVMQINGQDYRVVGVMKDLGNGLAAHDNSAIFVPFDDGKDLFRSQLAANEVTAIYIQVDTGFDVNEIKDTIEQKIANNHRVTLDNKDFSVITADFIRQTVGSILDLLSELLFAITAVATIVGGIGISNTMFMAVLERIREIGVLKSIGATDRDIRMIFLTESALIGLAGGMLGFAVAVAILLAAGQFGVPYLIRIRWVVFVFFFSIGVGVAAGYIPARQASKMEPVKALGYV